ncbi:hypothetical protein [Gloeocapsa sp. PCC 73106]|uniref:hypothetical protein n=1 Tax=Gloeocapsa sp. PCC 73106 TaxID=102232 RepID=UPI0002AC5F4D|nr:hypothetical protein [Gloeocapsa sp. PCC 73106]ELR99692.1 hypothetical protein GLO73106DRAFT_00035440 [Gloeocapsa sp. PCC 73106]
MGLKRQKGHFLVSKTQVSSLQSPKKDWILATKHLFNQVVEFYVLIYNTHHELALVPNKSVYTSIEYLTIPTKNREQVSYLLPYNCPSVFRRAAIKKALGIFKTWQTSYNTWQTKRQKLKNKANKKDKKVKLPRPPLLPRNFNCSPTLYKGMYKDDLGDSLLIKLWTGESWAWVKHQYQGYNLPSDWGASHNC